MGSDISPVLADIVMDDLETFCLSKLNFTPPFFFRYVDDTITIVPRDQIDNVIKVFNSYDPNLQFTMEIENNKQIPFLDLLLINDNNKIITNWYQKPIATNRFLNFFSHNPVHQKIGIVYNLVDRAILLADERFHTSNLEKIKIILNNNNYPADFVQKNINNRLTFLKNRDKNHSNNIKIANQRYYSRQTKVVLPFIPHITPNIQKILKKYNILTVFRSSNKLNSIIKLGKDPVNNSDLNDVVYKICCKQCEKIYIGQTKRTLKTRINEHKKDIDKINQANLNVISKHRIDNNHDFDWDTVKILDKEPNLQKRLISEMFHIHLNKNCINKMEDTHKLHIAYKNFINYINC